jgi:MarR family
MGRRPIPQLVRRRFNAAVDTLTSSMPQKWTIEVIRRSSSGGTVQAANASGDIGKFDVLVREELDPRSAAALDEPERPTFVFARWLSKRTRSILAERGFSYGDDSGNLVFLLDEPPIYIRLDGATQDPSPAPVKGPNLRGPKAWALLRTLIEVQPPYTVSELATAVGTDPGYVSRVLTALSEELLITRPPRGKVLNVEWKALLRQLSTSYALLDANETTNWVASAGPEQFLQDLATSRLQRWAVTGSFAAASVVSVAAPGIAAIYADDPELVADTLRLQQVQNGGNVVIARPYDQVVFERTATIDDITYVSFAQSALDCLTGPGRMPAEGEALVKWMSDSTSRWQVPSLTGEPVSQ